MRDFGLVILILISAISGYLFGLDFVRADHYQMHWLASAAMLVLIWVLLWWKCVKLNRRTGWLIGIVLGSILSLITMLVVRLATEPGLLDELGRVANQFGFIEFAYFLFVSAFLHFSWVPFFVLFLAVSLRNTD